MSQIRLLVGPRKGAFVLTADGKRQRWDISGPHFAGWEIYHITLRRRPFVRFFACEQDLSHVPPNVPLPGAVATGTEPFLIVGALAGG